MFKHTCYRFFQELKTHVVAHRQCENEGKGGLLLAAPSTKLEVGLFNYKYLLFAPVNYNTPYFKHGFIFVATILGTVYQGEHADQQQPC